MLLVDKANPAPADDGIRAVALASLSLYRRSVLWDHRTDLYVTWFAGAHAKIVRRADRKIFTALLAGTEPEQVIAIGEARAIAYELRPADTFPEPIRRLQVAGTNLPDLAPTPAPGAPAIVLNSSLGMSTGKAAAQAAHALLGHIRAVPSPLTDCRIEWRDADRFHDQISEAADGSVVIDHGRTEIEPGSNTAYLLRWSAETN